MARDGFSQAGDFFARAMRMQNAAAAMQTQAQTPAFNSMAADQQNTPGSTLFKAPSIDTLPALEEASMRSPMARPSAVMEDLLTKAKQKRVEAMVGAERAEPTMSQTSSESASSMPRMPQMATGGNSIESEFRPSFGRRPVNSVRAGQFPG